MKLKHLIILLVSTVLSTLLFSFVMAEAASVDAVVMKFSNELSFVLGGNSFLQHVDNGYDSTTRKYSTFEFATVNGEGCLRLKYHKHNNWEYYRVMPKLTKNKLTADHRYVRITYMTDDIMPGNINIYNNGTGNSIVLVPNTRVSGGKFVRSNAVDIWEDNRKNSDGSETLGMVNRLVNGTHCTFTYSAKNTDSNFYIKEIAFFKSEADAYTYYQDAPAKLDAPHTVLTFGEFSNGGVNRNTDWGNSVTNMTDSTVDISYAAKTNFGGFHYMAKIYFASEYPNASRKYARIVYSADVPADAGEVNMMIRNDAGGALNTISAVSDTAGQFVVTDTYEMPADIMTRFTNGGHNSLIFSGTSDKCEFRLKAVYFFDTKKAADEFVYSGDRHTITIGGRDISDYKIVLPADAPNQLEDCAKLIIKRVKFLTGVKLEIVDDTTPVSDCEILIGFTNRERSTEVFSEAGYTFENNTMAFVIDVNGTTVTINAFLPAHNKDAAVLFNQGYLYDGLSVIPSEIVINDTKPFKGVANYLKLYTGWAEVTNVSDPEVFRDDFSADDGYFREENGKDDFKIANGVMSGRSDDIAVSYIHVYEKNAEFSADIKYTEAERGSNFGVMLRYNSEDTWVKAGYDFDTGCYYIDSRDGADFYKKRVGEKLAEAPESGKYLNFKLICDGDHATLIVDGKIMIDNVKVDHYSPGKVAIYAENIEITADNAELKLLSGQGTVWKNINHTKIPEDYYTEGGTVLERDENTLTFLHHNGYTYDSTDGGVTWDKQSEQWIPISSYYNVLRLNNGDLLRIDTKSGYKVSYTSSDNGKTWELGGNICKTPYLGDSAYAANAGNMNDKITQSAPDGAYPNRIFYSQNYETRLKSEQYNNRMVFCEYYYSDDSGKTWIKSDTDSFEIVGNETETHFGECKLIECADGTIRMYCSWNKYGCIVYADSTDGGKNFGPLQKMTDFRVSRSSMQIVRDVYGVNNTTYYMVYVDTLDHKNEDGMPRCCLALCYSEDGKSWERLGEIWRWESTYRNNAAINHVVDPFINTSEDLIIFGSGFSDGLYLANKGGIEYHNAQRQHVYTIPKAAFDKAENFSKVFTSMEYTALPQNKNLVLIRDFENSETYSYNGTEFLYSDKYKAHVAILDASVTKDMLYGAIQMTDTPAECVLYEGDINGDGRRTAGDAALISSMLHNPEKYTADKYMKMLLEADVYGEFCTNANGEVTFVTVCDCTKALFAAIGLGTDC